MESFSFVIQPWKAADVEAELRQRGLTPTADHDGKGFESFWVKDPDGWPLQICNGNGLAKSRKSSPAAATFSEPAPFASTGWRTVWLDHFSFNASNYKASSSFYVNLLGWSPTYDEGSQNELLMATSATSSFAAATRWIPDFGKASGAPRRAGRSITSRSASRRGIPTA